MTKIYSPLLIQKDSEFILRYWTEEKPKYEYWHPHTSRFLNFGECIVSWEKSFEEVRIHPSCLEAFVELSIISLCKSLGWDFKLMWANSPKYKESIVIGIEIPPDNVEIREVSDKGIKDGALQFTPYAFLNAVEKEEKPIQLGDPMYNGKCKTCKCLTCICDPSPSEHNKEDFYKYGASLGIKINDLQRLAMLLKPSEHIQEETQEEMWDDVMSIAENFTPGTKSLYDYLQTKFKLIRK